MFVHNIVRPVVILYWWKLATNQPKPQLIENIIKLSGGTVITLSNSKDSEKSGQTLFISCMEALWFYPSPNTPWRASLLCLGNGEYDNSISVEKFKT